MIAVCLFDVVVLVLLAGILYHLGWQRGWRAADPYGVRRDGEVRP